MQIELEFSVGEIVFGVVHDRHTKPEIIRGEVEYITIDAEGIFYSLVDVETKHSFEVEPCDVTSDLAVALALLVAREKTWQERERRDREAELEYHEERIAELLKLLHEDQK